MMSKGLLLGLIVVELSQSFGQWVGYCVALPFCFPIYLFFEVLADPSHLIQHQSEKSPTWRWLQST